MQKNKMPVPTEAQEQMTLFSWAAMQKREISRIEFALSRPERREQTQGGSGTASSGGRESGRSRSMLARRARAISRALHRA